MEELFRLNSGQHIQNQIQNRFSEELNVSVELEKELEFVLRNANTFDPANFNKFSLEEIYTYLKASHIFYLDVCLPKLDNTLMQMKAKMPEEYWSIKMLSLFLVSYKKELIDHIEEEENVLFTFVDKLLAENVDTNYSDFVLNHFIHAHNDNVIIQLSDLKQDLLTFDKGLEGNLMVDVLFSQLDVFQQDLMVHGLIEDNVFIQKVQEKVGKLRV